MKKLITILFSIFVALSSVADTLSLNAENDFFAPGNTDKFYSHGSRISYFMPVTNFYDGVSSHILFGDKEAVEFSVGQYMYTPDDIEIVELQEGERPYAGVAFLEIAQIKYDEKQYSRVGFLGGVIGPLAYCEDTQTWIHEQVGCELPLGWDNQINDEPIANIQYTYKYNILSGSWYSLTPRSETALGNAHIFTGVGTDLRLGYNIDTWTYSTMEPVPREFNDLAIDTNNLSCFLLLGTGVKYVARNITLDGNTWQDSYSIDKEPIVSEYYYGLGLKYSQIGVEYRINHRSEEFKGQKEQEEFGSVSLRFQF